MCGRNVSPYAQNVERCLEREEETGVREPLPELRVVEPLVAAAKICYRDIVVRSVKEAMQWLVARLMPARTAAKLLKDVTKSAARKALRSEFGNRTLVRAAKVVRTAGRAHTIAVLSDAAVTQVGCHYRYHVAVCERRNRRRPTVRKDTPTPIVSSSSSGSNDDDEEDEDVLAIDVYRKETLMNIIRHALQLSCASIGAGVGAYIVNSRGIGAGIGLLLGDMLGLGIASRLDAAAGDAVSRLRIQYS